MIIQGDRKNREDSRILMSQVSSFFEHESIEEGIQGLECNEIKKITKIDHKSRFFSHRIVRPWQE